MAKYPTWEVGDIVTADALSAMQQDITYKATTTTRASTSTLADDPDLITPVLAANGTYLVEFEIRYATTLAAAFKTSWSMPSGVLSANRAVSGLGQVGTTGSNDNTPSGTTFAMRSGVHNYATAIGYGSRDSVSNQVRAYETSVVVMGSTSGTVTLQWAQIVSTAVNTTLNSGSFVRVTRMS